MDPETLREVNNIIVSLSALIAAIAAVWIKISQNKNATENKQQNDEIKEKVEIVGLMAKDKIEEVKKVIQPKPLVK